MLNVEFQTFPEIETARLLLNAFNESDANNLFVLRSDPNVLQYLDTDPPKNEGEMVEFLKGIQKSYQQGDGISWAIRMPDNNLFIGSIAIWKIDKVHHRGEIGYMILPEFWGKGIASEALTKVIAFGFNEIGLHSIQGNINKDNAASERILQKFGFQKEAHFRENWHHNGRFVDSIIYGLLASEFSE